MEETRNESAGQLAVVRDDARPRQLTMIDEWDESQRSIRTTIDTNTDDGRVRYIAALTGSDAEARDSVGRELTVSDWLLHVVDRVDRKTGEVNPGLRLVLIGPDGKTISSASGSLIDNWAHVVRMFGNVKPWPVLVVTIKAVRSRNNEGSYLQLASVRRAETTQPERQVKGK